MSVHQGNLLVYGAGYLGSRAGVIWKEKQQHSKVLAVTKTTKDHQRLESKGFTVQTSDQKIEQSYPNVIFSVPPSKTHLQGDPNPINYEQEIQKAIDAWDQKGGFVLTSSMGVYNAVDTISENSPVFKLGDNERLDRMVAAENQVLKAGGIVLRLAGLYHLTRGAHSFYLKNGTINRNPNYVINQIHYEDAAQLVVALLLSGARQEAFNGVDEQPTSAGDIIKYAIESGHFKDHPEINFVYDKEKPLEPQRYLSGKKAKEQLNFTHKFPSFKKFMLEQTSEDPYN